MCDARRITSVFLVLLLIGCGDLPSGPEETPVTPSAAHVERRGGPPVKPLDHFFSVYIDGPTQFCDLEVLTWTAYPSGQHGSVSYLWQINGDLYGSGSWFNVGTGQQYADYPWGPDYHLRVIATDATQQQANYMIQVMQPFWC